MILSQKLGILFEKAKSDDLARKGLSDTLWYFLAIFGNKLFQILLIPILGRNLSIGDFAQYDLFLTVSTVLLVILLFGMDSGLAVMCVRHRDHPQQLRFLLTAGLVAVFLLGTSLAIFVGCFLELHRFASVSFAFVELIICFSAISAAQSLLCGFSRWLGNAKRASTMLFLSGMTTNLMGLAGVAVSVPNGLFVGLCIGNSISLAASLWMSRRYLTLLWPESWKRDFVEYARASVPVMGASLGIQGRRVVDRFLILAFLGEQQLGQYAMLARIAQIPDIAMQTVGNAFFPNVLANIHLEKGKRMARMLLTGAVFAMFGVTAIASAFAPLILRVMGGTSYMSSAGTLGPIVASTALSGIIFYSGFGFFSRNQTGRYSVVIISSTILGSISILALLNVHASIGAVAAGNLTGSIVLASLYLWESERLLPVHFNRKLIVGTISALCMLCALLLWMDIRS